MIWLRSNFCLLAAFVSRVLRWRGGLLWDVSRNYDRPILIELVFIVLLW